ncbi:phosphoadenosine phosphosulfate reductase [Streptomyces sp. NPDC058595]|uniref:phosphoadenosine phosphosulfate reductase n=1 Tax=Streptomyces sp. NPDC058595 TaxID=3346550 RepID=UPI00364FCA7E
MNLPSGTVTRASVPDLSDYDLVAPQLSGGQDSALTMCLTMEAAVRDGVPDRVRSYHSALPVLDWPEVVHDGQRWPGVAELAARQGAAFGPTAGHTEVTRMMPGPDGTPMPHSLLTEIALYGRFPRMGSKFCTKSAKESVVNVAWTPYVRQRSKELGRPVRILKAMGMRRDESRGRSTLEPYRNVVTNGARIVDEWLPALMWKRNEVQEWSEDHPELKHWTYDSVPGAMDWLGTRRCSCSLCSFAGYRDHLIAIRRRPRLAALYAEVETVRGDSLTAGRRITDLIHLAHSLGAPDSGVVLPDDGPEFTAVAHQVRTALTLPPRKAVDLAARADDEPSTPCDGCSAFTQRLPLTRITTVGE